MPPNCLPHQREKPSGRFLKKIAKEFRVNEKWLRTGDGESYLASQPDKELLSGQEPKPQPSQKAFEMVQRILPSVPM